MGQGTISGLSGKGNRNRIMEIRCDMFAGNTRRPGLLAVLLALVFCALPACGGEEDLYAQLLRRYDRVNDELSKVLAEADEPYRLPEYPDRLLSVRKNATVTIGGEVRATYTFTNSKWKDPGFNPAIPNSTKIESRGGDLSLPTAKLLIDARAGDRWRAFMDIDLNGYQGFHRRGRLKNVTTAADPDPVYERETPTNNINQAYIELLKSGHSGFGLMAGLMKLPFGLWTRPNLFAQSYMDAPDLTGSYLAGPAAWDSAVRLPHASRFVDPVAAAMVTYEMRDIIRFEAALFQEYEQGRNLKPVGNGRYRSDSDLPRSWQVGFSILPLEGWELTTHFRNRYSRNQGLDAWADSPYRWDFGRNLVSGGHNPKWDPVAEQWSDSGTGPSFGARSSEQALIVGLAVEIPNTKLAVRAEYAHGWNQGFNKYINSDGVNVGLSYRLTPLLTLHAQGEWLHVKDRSWMAETAAPGVWARDSRNNRLYRTLIGAEYELGPGLTLEAGWQYEYWKITSSMGNNGGHGDRLNTANMFYFGSRFIF